MASRNYTVHRSGGYRRTSDDSPGGGDPTACGCCAVFVFGAVLIWSEMSAAGTANALAVVRDQVTEYGDSSGRPFPSPGKKVQFHGDAFASSYDDTFGVSLPGVALIRKTEYCQWQELQEKICRDQCPVVVEDYQCSGADSREACSNKPRGCKWEGGRCVGGPTGETYGCDCYIKYDYIKKWFPTLISSSGFDQAARHHNPWPDAWQEFDSADLMASDAFAGDWKISPRLFGAKYKSSTTGTRIRLEQQGKSPEECDRYRGQRECWRDDGCAWFRGSCGPSLNAMAFTLDRSSAPYKAGFVYTTDGGGYFYRPYKTSLFEELLLGFGQYYEGTLGNFQFGDVIDMIGGCYEGDTRVSHYLTPTPGTFSVLGQAANGGEIVSFTQDGVDLGSVRAGRLDKDEMFQAELADNSSSKWMWRVICGICIVGGLMACTGGGGKSKSY